MDEVGRDSPKRKEKREKRISSFLGKKKESAKMEIPRSAGFINPRAVWSKDKEMSTDVDKAFKSLSINMVEVGDQEVGGTRLPPFS